MRNMKLTVTQEKREATMDKILKLIEVEFQEVEITPRFTKKLLEGTITVLDISNHMNSFE
ncbi:hypothetical protein ACJDU8_18415 [Clostridium sp. WILCCON 0269]|uniref:Uncharacterized protein n=1 Tax=Candidatus Clostridium eludens TaxID=3381663 RepID=A0ABW8SQ83_9CLOT